MVDITRCPAEVLAESIVSCTTLEQMKIVTALAQKTKKGLSDSQKKVVVDAVLDRSRELSAALHVHSVNFAGSF
jgi:hypothetical protein